MSGTIQLEIVTPSKVLLDKSVELVVIPGSEGLFGVLPKHSDLLANLKMGIVEVHESGKIIDRIAINGGIADVNATKVTILAQFAEDINKSSSKDIKDKLITMEGEEKAFFEGIINLI